MLTKTFDFTKYVNCKIKYLTLSLILFLRSANSRVMCTQYWPASKEKDECYGETPEHQIYIGVAKEEELANFHIRTFRLYKMNNNVCFNSFVFFFFFWWHYQTQQDTIFLFNYFNYFNQVRTEERSILQFHYTEWHSHTCPFSNAILEFRRRVRSVVGSTLKSHRPMLVHCNDGGKNSSLHPSIKLK